MSKSNRFYNMDCVQGCQEHVRDNSVDLIITDPPYGIGGDQLHKHYNRKEEFVIDGYVEVPEADYPAFTHNWIREAERILRPGGSLYIVSGYTNLIHILNALHATQLEEVNHLIWKYNFGVYTKRKYISSHYHILFYEKPGGPRTFNTFCRFGPREKTSGNGSLNYADREDVWVINREYKPGQVKNKNELPSALLMKLIQYSSDEGDTVCDLFLGSFSAARIAIGLNRRALGFEMSRTAYEHHLPEVESLVPGSLLADLPTPDEDAPANQGRHWTPEEALQLTDRYRHLRAGKMTKKEAVDRLCEEFGRGYWSIVKQLDKTEPADAETFQEQRLF